MRFNVLTGEVIRITASGRTDAGVHAQGASILISKHYHRYRLNVGV